MKDQIVFVIAVISMTLLQIGKTLEKTNTNAGSILYGSKEYPDRIWKFNYSLYMAVTAITATIFCIWAVGIYVPRIVHDFMNTNTG